MACAQWCGRRSNVYLDHYGEDPQEADEVLDLIGRAISHLV
jgi:hypothetical protein